MYLLNFCREGMQFWSKAGLVADIGFKSDVSMLRDALRNISKSNNRQNAEEAGNSQPLLRLTKDDYPPRRIENRRSDWEIVRELDLVQVGSGREPAAPLIGSVPVVFVPPND